MERAVTAAWPRRVRPGTWIKCPDPACKREHQAKKHTGPSKFYDGSDVVIDCDRLNGLTWYVGICGEDE